MILNVSELIKVGRFRLPNLRHHPNRRGMADDFLFNLGSSTDRSAIGPYPEKNPTVEDGCE